MLTLILLVVLAGAVGLLAVSLAESKTATHTGIRRRGQAAGAALAGGFSDALDRARARRPRAEPETPSAPPTDAPSDRVVAPPGPPTRRRGKVPKTQTAVEGRYADVARPSSARRIVSSVGLAVIVVVVAVGIAAIVGGVVGAAAEIVDNTIG